MEESPLTLEEQSAIEGSKEFILQHAKVMYDLLNLEKPLFDVPNLSKAINPQATPKPATLKLQFQKYCSSLFDAEAPHYLQHAKTEIELRSWLEKRAEHIAPEVLKQVWDRTHSFHCSQTDCKDAIEKGLKDRIEHWMAEYRKIATSKHRVPEDPIEPVSGKTAWTTPEQSRDAKAKAMMARAKEVLEGSDTPTQKQAMSIPPLPPRNAPAIERLKFSRRASWLKERLRERDWDHNRPPDFGGPDRKTIKRILRGDPVHDGTLDKLVNALNKHPKAKRVSTSDVPSD